MFILFNCVWIYWNFGDKYKSLIIYNMNNCLICAHFSQCFVIEIRNSIRFRALVVKPYQTSMSNLFHYFPDPVEELDSEPPPELPPIPGPPENIWNSSIERILLIKFYFFFENVEFFHISVLILKRAQTLWIAWISSFTSGHTSWWTWWSSLSLLIHWVRIAKSLKNIQSGFDLI